jgi:hypothetical protein
MKQEASLEVTEVRKLVTKVSLSNDCGRWNQNGST